MNILIVDDIPENIFSLKALITSNNNVQVFEALSANIALSAVLKNTIDLILCDIQMPEMDGFEFARLLQTNIKTKDIPIIFISAIYNNEEYKSEGYDIGAIDYITKPINEKVLQSKLSKYIEIFKVRKKLEEQNKYIKRIIETSNEANLIIDSSFNLIDLNDKLKSIFLDLKINDNVLIYLENKNISVLAELKNYLLKSKDSNNLIPLTIEYEKRYYKITFKDIEPNHIVIFYDITTEIKDAKRENVIYNSQQSIIIVTNNNTINSINNIFFKEYGFKDLEEFKFHHRCISELFVKQENDDYLQATVDGIQWNKYIFDNSNFIHKVCMINRHGEERILQVQSSGKILEEDEIIFFTDITDIENKNKLLISQSRQAAMGEMINIIAHQWRQPLTTVSTILSKIQVKQELELLTKIDLNNNIENITSVITHLSKTINLFQNYFKEKNGKKISITKLFTSINIIILPIMEKNEIKNQFESLEDYIIDDRLDHVLLNIYQNASDELIRNQNIKNKTICTKIFKNNKNQIEISIYDNAGGIPENIINKIFEPYFSTKGKNGTGLGLYMSKNIVENYIGGSLVVKNEKDGACFTIILPI